MTPVSIPHRVGRGPSWRQFLTAQAKAVLAVDFVHGDTVFLKTDLCVDRSRARITPGTSARRDHASDRGVDHASRPHLLMDLADQATKITFLLRDRDSRFTEAFDAVFAADNIRILTSPSGAPRANAICEHMIGTLRRELLDRVLVVNEPTYAGSALSTCTISTLRGHIEHSNNSHRPRPTPNLSLRKSSSALVRSAALACGILAAID